MRRRVVGWITLILTCFVMLAGCEEELTGIQSLPVETAAAVTDDAAVSAVENLTKAAAKPAAETRTETTAPEEEAVLPEDGTYDSKEDVALYIHLYSHLPENYITKREAQDLGWPGGSLEPYAKGCSIGGGRFGNYEGRLPEAKGRQYWECDIDTRGKKSRGAKRIVYSNDGLIYYTDDHYETFELLYGEE